MEGLLTYLFGGNDTAWGRQRIADGHPEPYAPFPIICSNEEPQQQCDGKYWCYIAAFRRWANVTKATAVALGVWPLTLGVALESGAHRYYNESQADPWEGGAAEMIQAIVEAGLDEVLWDQHGDGGVAAGWGDGRDWASILAAPSPASMQVQSAARGKRVRAIMLEENGGGCGLARALGHVSNSLALQRVGSQVAGLAAAGMFWPGAEGATNSDYQIKFMADRIVRAPFWWANKMLSESHQPNVIGGYHTSDLNASRALAASPLPFADWMGAVSDDGRRLVLRVQNANGAPLGFVATVAGTEWAAPSVSCEALCLSHTDGDARNDYDTPDNVVPRTAAVSCQAGRVRATLSPNSFTVLTLVRS